MDPIAALAVGGAAAYYFLVHNKKEQRAFQAVTGGTTGKPWKTRVIDIQGTGDNKVSTVELWAPAGSWGPHLDVLVVTYQQKGSDKNSRVTLGTGPNAIAQMVSAAGQDFGIKKPEGALISGKSAPDHKFPIFHRTGRHIGSLDVWNGGDVWKWRATRLTDGKQFGTGSALTLSEAQQKAAVRAARSC